MTIELISPNYPKNDYNSRLMAALVNYFEGKLLGSSFMIKGDYKKVTEDYSSATYNQLASILFMQAAELEFIKNKEYLYNFPLFNVKTIQGKEKQVTKEDLAKFVKIMSYGSFTIKLHPKKQKKKITKEHLIRLYIIYICHLERVAELKRAGAKPYKYQRKLHHVTQILENNKDVWDYSKVEGNLKLREVISREKLPKNLLPTCYYGTRDYYTPTKPPLYKLQIVDLVNNQIVYSLDLRKEHYMVYGQCSKPNLKITVENLECK